MDEYNCNGCSYTYRPSRGDKARSIVPGTAFERLPEDWTCPECGAGKLGFKRAATVGKGKKRAEDDQGHVHAEDISWKSSVFR